MPTILAPSNFVPLNAPLIFLSASLIRSSLSSSGNMSILFNTTMRFRVVISAMTRHSAVWVCMPFVASTTRRTMSMIWAPPMMVRMREAWPGQSTSVTWRRSYLFCSLVVDVSCCGLGLLFLFLLSLLLDLMLLLPLSLFLELLLLPLLLELPLLFPPARPSPPPLLPPSRTSALVKCSGNGNKNAENPKSKVIPLARLCLLLSNAAVLSTLLRVLTKEVLPVSTWPRTPTFKLSIRSGGMDLICSGESNGREEEEEDDAVEVVVVVDCGEEGVGDSFEGLVGVGGAVEVDGDDCCIGGCCCLPASNTILIFPSTALPLPTPFNITFLPTSSKSTTSANTPLIFSKQSSLLFSTSFASLLNCPISIFHAFN
mmetsp:Transcript_30394/g.65634  ORF Transcript_30394/g.65634 Transcript_30394/m.65634 type:complete len:371 (-) Transcript_30394:510-1622(-)